MPGGRSAPRCDDRVGHAQPCELRTMRTELCAA
jgi:hypothetical protein